MTQQGFSYTNHTLMPEALETWPVSLMQHVPRHLEIIFRINQEFLAAAHSQPGATAASARLSLIDENGERACAWPTCPSSAATGSTVFRRCTGPAGQDHLRRLRALWPERFTNMTNGVTPRRWLAGQPRPGRRCSTAPGREWRLDLDRLRACCLRATTPASAPSSWPSSSPTRRAWRRHRATPPAPAGSTRTGSLFDAGQAHPRIQAPAAEPAARGGRYQAILADPARRLGAAHGDLRRQGGVVHAAAPDHPADPRRRQR